VKNLPAVANTDVTNDGAEDASMSQKNVQFMHKIATNSANLTNHEYLFSYIAARTGNGGK